MALLPLAVYAGSVKYRLLPGDTLTQVLEVQGHKKIYSRSGALSQTCTLNGFSRTQANHLRAGRVILLPEAQAMSPIALTPDLPPVMTNQRERELSQVAGVDEWNISAFYGVKYLSLSQSGELGKAEFGALFLHNLKLKSEFVFEEWTTWFLIESYKFKYESLDSADEKQMYALNLGLSYKWMMAGLGFEQNPLFKKNNGTIEMVKQGQLLFLVGGKKDIELPTKKPTLLMLKGWINYPLATATDNTDVEVSSVTGMGVKGQIELNRKLFSKAEYSLHASWLTDLSYQKISQNVKWSSSTGKVDSTLIGASTSLGILFKF